MIVLLKGQNQDTLKRRAVLIHTRIDFVQKLDP